MSRTANIKIFVPTPLRRYCNGVSELSVAAANILDLFEELERRYPELHRCVCRLFVSWHDNTGVLVGWCAVVQFHRHSGGLKLVALHPVP